MELCTKCAGKGLVGAGENPAALQGAVSTCPDCKGTGKVEESTVEVVEVVEE